MSDTEVITESLIAAHFFSFLEETISKTVSICKDFAPENLAVVHHISLNLLTKENTLNLSIKNKRLRPGWEEDYVLNVLLA